LPALRSHTAAGTIQLMLTLEDGRIECNSAPGAADPPGMSHLAAMLGYNIEREPEAERYGKRVMKFELHITNYGGLVAGARHRRGRVVGEHPRSCHGGTVFRGATGKTTCAEGHELPDRIEWDVEAPWSEARHRRWAARRYEDAGPAQYTDEAELVRDAIGRFLGLLTCRRWEEQVPAAKPGDELYLGRTALYGDHPSPDGWGHRIAVMPGEPSPQAAGHRARPAPEAGR
jgi:hypothetical protein